MLLLSAAVAALPLTAKPLMDTTQVFHLGEVTVFEHQRTFKADQVSADFIKSADMQRVSEALNWIPGLIVQETGGRSEAGFMLRGISSAEVPVYIDGVPMTAPYDGTVDLYRLSAGMLSKIDVSKSASSLLMGGNTLGPSINLVSRQPQKPLELHFDMNTLWHSNLNVGGDGDNGSRRSTWAMPTSATSGCLTAILQTRLISTGTSVSTPGRVTSTSMPRWASCPTPLTSMSWATPSCAPRSMCRPT